MSKRNSFPPILWIVITTVTAASIVIFPSVQSVFWDVYGALDVTWQWVLDLGKIGLIALLVAALLAPLEALGWWAGWYGDEVDTNAEIGVLAEPLPDEATITRYVVYLDGISQAQFEHLPEVERFLEALAIALTDDIVLIKGLMPYSVTNQPLTQDRLLSAFWRLADRLQMTASGGMVGALVGATINIRNILTVSVSADQRYGPIYNQGTAQVIYNSLLSHGYPADRQIPITLLGYSGGAQMAIGAAPYLKRALKTSIEVISLSGVMSGNQNLLELDHLYHLVGKKDWIEKEGPILFPRRWRVFFLSYWNRAKRRGKISLISLGAVGHNATDGPYGAETRLPDGRTYLEQTTQLVSGIIQGTSSFTRSTPRRKPSDYQRYQQAAFNRPDYYPIDQPIDRSRYHPIAPWMGRLILPAVNQRSIVRGVLFEVHYAPSDYQHLLGKQVTLRWSDDPAVRRRVQAVTKDVYFSDEAQFNQAQGYVHPERLDHWRRVDPLESLAGARPEDDVIVRLIDPVIEATGAGWSLAICHEPVQITGRYYGLVRVVEPLTATAERFRVVHFNPATCQFDGAEEVVRFPAVVPDGNGNISSTTRGLEQSPMNGLGWYIYGANDQAGEFVVRSLAPRALLRLHPDTLITGANPSIRYLRQAWDKAEVSKGQVKSVVLCPQPATESDVTTPALGELEQAIAKHFSVGTRSLVLHVYGGIGGIKAEPAAKAPVFFGHFAYGVAEVVREPLANELQFDIRYYQVYTHNDDGIVAGTLSWACFMGDRQWGWLGVRPTCDLIVRLEAFTQDYDLKGLRQSALDQFIDQLEMMTARYRIGDGTGGTYVGAANNCAQDSNQALYAALRAIKQAVESNPDAQAELADEPDEARQFEQLIRLGRSLRHDMFPLGTARADWQTNAENLGSSLEEEPLKNLLTGLLTWRTLLPRKASDTVALRFLQQNALIWVLRTNQVGGVDPTIEPVIPMTL